MCFPYFLLYLLFFLFSDTRFVNHYAKRFFMSQCLLQKTKKTTALVVFFSYLYICLKIQSDINIILMTKRHIFSYTP